MTFGNTFRACVVLVTIAVFFFHGDSAKAEDALTFLELLFRLLALLA